MRFEFCIPVWGAHFVDLFTRLSLPTHLADGNIPLLAKHGPVRYHLWTTMADAPAITASPAYQHLRRYATVDIHEFDGPNVSALDASTTHLDPKYTATNHCFKVLLRDLDRSDDDTFYMPWNADIVLSSHLGAGILAHLQAGKRAVLTGVFCGIREALEPILLQNHVDANGAITIDERQLTKLTIDNLHPYTRTHSWQSPISTQVPSTLHWPVADHGMLTYSYHWSPLAFALNDIPREMAEYGATIDTSMAFEAFRNSADIGIIDDSDDGFLCEACPIQYLRTLTHYEAYRTPESVADLLYQSYHYGTLANLDQHLAFSLRPCRAHAIDLDDAFAAQERNATAIITAINEILVRRLAAERAAG